MGFKDMKPRTKIALVLLALLILTAVVLHLPAGKVKIEIRRDTTYIDGPLNPDGTVNYLAAMDAEYSMGVTADNNAVPGLLKAIGPELLPKKDREKILDRIGLKMADISGPKIYTLWDNHPTPLTTTPAEPDPDFATILDDLKSSKVHPDLDAWLSINADSMEAISKTLAQKDRYYIPMLPSASSNVTDHEIGSGRYLRDVGRAFAARAILRSGNGDSSGAWEDVKAVHRLAKLIDQPPWLIDHLVSVAVETIAYETGTFLITNGVLPPDPESLLADLASLRPAGKMVEVIDRGERYFMLDAIMLLSRGGNLDELVGSMVPLPSGSNLDWNAMLRQANSWMDKMTAPLKMPRGPARNAAAAEFNRQCCEIEDHVTGDLRWRMTLLRLCGWPLREELSKEYMNTLAVILMPTLSKAAALEDAAKVGHEVEVTALALHLYKRKSGTYPSDLAKLCPDYLKSVPVDLFTDKPLIYRKTTDGYVLYSVGKNEVDDGGINDRASDKDDIVARVGAPGAASGPATASAPASAPR